MDGIRRENPEVSLSQELQIFCVNVRSYRCGWQGVDVASGTAAYIHGPPTSQAVCLVQQDFSDPPAESSGNEVPLIQFIEKRPIEYARDYPHRPDPQARTA
jgi:hypothetical protein